MNILQKNRIFTSNQIGSIIPSVETNNVVADGSIGTIPAGFMLQGIIISEINGGVVEINIGTVAGGNDIINAYAIGAGTLTTLNINTTYSLTAAQQIFISDTGAGWGTSKLNVILLLRAI